MDPATAALLAPTIIKLGANLFRSDKPSPYERRLSKFATMFDEQASQPITQNRTYKAGKKLLDVRDEKNRKAINNQSAVTGATDEAKLANIQKSNESYDSATAQLLKTAQQYRDRMRTNALDVYGRLENARLGRNQQFQSDLNNIVAPIQAASNTFLMSSMFKEPSLKSPKSPSMRDVNNLISTPGWSGM